MSKTSKLEKYTVHFEQDKTYREIKKELKQRTIKG